MPFTTLTNNNFLNAAHGKATYTAPTNLFVGLSTTLPTVAGTNVTEPVGSGYARVQVPAASFGTAASSSITNTAAVNFATATGSGWGTIGWVPVYDALTAGNLLFWAAITSQAVPGGVAPSFAVGTMTSTLS